MAGEVQQLRELIEQRLRDSAHVSLVEVLAAFDHRNHSLPSTWRWNSAIAGITPPLALLADGLALEALGGNEPVTLSDTDVSRVVSAYREAIRSRPAPHGV